MYNLFAEVVVIVMVIVSLVVIDRRGSRAW